MPAFFCEKTGVRIVAPGVSKSVDPENGQDECLEVDGKIVLVADEAAPPKSVKHASEHPAKHSVAPESAEKKPSKA